MHFLFKPVDSKIDAVLSKLCVRVPSYEDDLCSKLLFNICGLKPIDSSTLNTFIYNNPSCIDKYKYAIYLLMTDFSTLSSVIYTNITDDDSELVKDFKRYIIANHAELYKAYNDMSVSDISNCISRLTSLNALYMNKCINKDYMYKVLYNKCDKHHKYISYSRKDCSAVELELMHHGYLRYNNSIGRNIYHMLMLSLMSCNMVNGLIMFIMLHYVDISTLNLNFTIPSVNDINDRKLLLMKSVTNNASIKDANGVNIDLSHVNQGIKYLPVITINSVDDFINNNSAYIKQFFDRIYYIKTFYSLFCGASAYSKDNFMRCINNNPLIANNTSFMLKLLLTHINNIYCYFDGYRPYVKHINTIHGYNVYYLKELSGSSYSTCRNRGYIMHYEGFDTYVLKPLRKNYNNYMAKFEDTVKASINQTDHFFILPLSHYSFTLGSRTENVRINRCVYDAYDNSKFMALANKPNEQHEEGETYIHPDKRLFMFVGYDRTDHKANAPRTTKTRLWVSFIYIETFEQLSRIYKEFHPDLVLITNGNIEHILNKAFHDNFYWYNTVT